MKKIIQKIKRIPLEIVALVIVVAMALILGVAFKESPEIHLGLEFMVSFLLVYITFEVYRTHQQANKIQEAQTKACTYTIWFTMRTDRR